MGMGVERSRSMKINYIIRNIVSNLLMIVAPGGRRHWVSYHCFLTQWRRNSRGAQASTPSLKGPQIDLSSKSWWDRHIQCQMHAVEVSRCSLDSMDLSIVIEPNFLQCLNSTNDRTASTAFLKMFVGRAAHRLHSRNY